MRELELITPEQVVSGRFCMFPAVAVFYCCFFFFFQRHDIKS